MFKRLFQDTTIYGTATVLPRMMALLLIRLYVSKLDTNSFGIYSGIFVYLILGNVLPSYGMETTFFRFTNKGEQKKQVQSTAFIFLAVSSLSFLLFAYLLKESIASWLNYRVEHIVFGIYIMVFDALAVIPFAWLRNKGKVNFYAFIKVGSTAFNLLLNIYFLNYLSQESIATNGGVCYIFLADIIASLATLIVLLPIYIKIRFRFYYPLWKEMMIYAFPVLLAGIASATNEGFGRIFLRMLLPEETADVTIGTYSAYYKMGVFMNLFVSASKLEVEPFFFSSAQDKNAPKTYVRITEYFIVCNGFILAFITVSTDVFKLILIPNKAYWGALWIVPIVLPTNLCLDIYHSLSVWYKVTDCTSFGAIVSLVDMAPTVFLNFALIPWLSYKGVILTTLITYGAMTSISYYYGREYYPVPYNEQEIKVFLGMSVLFSFLESYLFNCNTYIECVFLLIYSYLASLTSKFRFRKNKKTAL